MVGICKNCGLMVQEHVESLGQCITCLSESNQIYTFFNTGRSIEIKNISSNKPCICCTRTGIAKAIERNQEILCSDCAYWIIKKLDFSVDDFLKKISQSWLVRSSGRILGPYSRDQIRKALHEREVVPLDEVARPLRPWSFIRNEKEFITFLEEVANRATHLRDDTMTETSGTVTDTEVTDEMTKSIESWKTVSNRFGDELQVKKVDEPEKSHDQLKTFGSQLNSKDQKQLRKYSTMLWVSAIVIGIVIFIFAFIFYFKKTNHSEKLSYDDLVQNAFIEKKNGNFRNAINFFRRAYQINSSDIDLIVEFAPLLIVYENNTVEAGRMLDRVLLEKHRAAYVRAAYTGLGLSALTTGHIDLAKDHFDSALKVDQHFSPALINLGVVYFLKENFFEAEKYLMKAYQSSQEQGVPALLLVKLFIVKALKGNNRELYLNKAKEWINVFQKNNEDYLQESKLLLAYIAYLQKEMQQMIINVESLLDSDPRQTDDHWHDPLIYRWLLSWGRNIDACKKIYKERSLGPRVKAFYGYCLFRSGYSLDGIKKIREAITQSPDDPLIQSVYSYMLSQTGQDHEAKSALSIGLKSKNYQLPFILQVRRCLKQNDQNCSRDSLNHLIKINSNSLMAISSLAYIDILDGQLESAEEKVKFGLAKSNRYIPFLKLQQQLVYGDK